jgi:TolB-like protein/DNA-binding winged helix-turn-helix (wHTH) protein/Tfp pilus assembly protein PilF
VASTLETNRFFDFGPYRLDRKARVLLRDEGIVPLTPKVVDTLIALVEHRGSVVSKDELLHSVWPDSFVEESNLSQNISVLRKALALGSGQLTYIETVSKRGYRFVAEVKSSPSIPDPSEKDAWVEPVETQQTGLTAPSTARFRVRSAALIGTTVLLCAVASFWYYQHRRPGVPRIRSIAVLPLRNLSGDPEQDYFADGITELLTEELSKTLRVRVTSRTSAMRYRDTGKPLPVIARELNVDAVLEGSVIRSGNRLRVTAQLIHAPSDRHLWAQTYDRDLVDVLTLQIEIARAVAHEIRAEGVIGNERRTAAVNSDAFEAYLRARYYLDRRTGEEINKAISWYQKAIEADPAYAPAYAGLADCYNQLGTVMVGDRSPLETRKLAMAAASRALEIDPELAEAHAALAYSNLYNWNWDRAQDGFQRAVSLNPNYAPGHLWFAHYLAARGQFDRALQEVRLASDLDPLSPIMQTQIGWILVYAHRIPEGVAQYRQVLERNPAYQWAEWQLGLGLMFLHDYGAAIETFQNGIRNGDRSPAVLGTLGMAYGLAGRRKEAEDVLNELLALSQHRYISPHSIMHIYIGLGAREKAFEWMEKSYQQRTNGMVWLAVWPGFDTIRDDPRFEMYLRRIGLK